MDTLTTDPELMTPQERQREVAALLAGQLRHEVARNVGAYLPQCAKL